MLNKAIAGCVALILLALAVKGLEWGNGCLAEIQHATQQRSAAYALVK